MTVHLIAYTTNTGLTGIARIRTDRARPSWADCHQQIDGYFTGKYLGTEPQYTIKYRTQDGPAEKTAGPNGIQSVGRLLMRMADRDEVWDIAVTDSIGADVTFNFGCFRG